MFEGTNFNQPQEKEPEGEAYQSKDGFVKCFIKRCFTEILPLYNLLQRID